MMSYFVDSYFVFTFNGKNGTDFGECRMIGSNLDKFDFVTNEPTGQGHALRAGIEVPESIFQAAENVELDITVADDVNFVFETLYTNGQCFPSELISLKAGNNKITHNVVNNLRGCGIKEFKVYMPRSNNSTLDDVAYKINSIEFTD